ncbi:MAG: glucose-6-phosphate isomerase, partial [Cyanobacteria bacterium HKST-UBA06]|nr:glucose-6-phosphate isomerase [Cyanobacteria bacterium HKST-UBA06]
MIELDASGCYIEQVGPRGLDRQALLGAHAARVAQVVADCWQRAADPNDWLGWLNLADWSGQVKVLDALQAYADAQHGKVAHLVIVGIGGSCLGVQAMFESLLPAYWNELSPAARDHRPKVYYVDNVDPGKLADLLNVLDLKTTLVVVMSKSGSTAETMAGFLWLKATLEDRLGKAALPDHMVFVTDPKKGALREIAQEEGIVAFDVPPSVGGR